MRSHEHTRRPFAHDAVVVLEPGGDPRAPGAAITTALCGHWEHAPPCPLAPHHTATDLRADVLALRVLFAAEAADEAEVRARIGAALAGGHLVGPEGRETRWRLREHGPSTVRLDEGEHAARLADA